MSSHNMPEGDSDSFSKDKFRSCSLFKRSHKNQKQNRIIDRDSNFKQSFGRWNIRRIKVGESIRLYLFDPFHSILHRSLIRLSMLIVFAYLVVICIWSCFYLAVDDSCNMAIETFQQSFYFSLITLLTIGYSTGGTDLYFNDCKSALLLILFEALFGVCLYALSIGIIFQRFSRGQSRANTVIFTNYSCVRRIRGHLYFMFQVCEMRKHQLAEAHVRCYTVRRDVSAEFDLHFQSYPMRLQHPSDILGEYLLLTLPSVVVHRIDNWSPLLPPSLGLDVSQHQIAHDYLFPEPLQREADVENGYRELIFSENYHANNQFDIDSPRLSMKSINSTDDNQRLHFNEVEEISKFWKDTNIEIIVLIEGIDAATSSTIQVRHSYNVKEILFDHAFKNCVSYCETTDAAIVDFNEFHEMTPCDFECITVRGTHY